MVRRVMPIALVLLVFLPRFVLAQGETEWRYFDNPQAQLKGAAICPLNDAQSGNFWCFSLGCAPDQPRKFTIHIAGGDVPDGLNYVSVTVDGQQAGVIEMQRSPPNTPLELNAPYDARKHAALLEKIKRGSTARIDVIQDQVRSQIPISLRGSRAALDQAFAACPDIPVSVGDPQAELLAQMSGMCAQMNGGQITVQPGFATAQDVTMDGRPDLIFDHSWVSCSTAATLWCGTAGCPVVIYRALPTGGYQEIWNAYARGWRVTEGDQPVIEFSVHGTACGGIGADACYQNVMWTGQQLQLIR